MKIRNGFVSNSSSSSFIIAIKDTDKYETKMKSILKEEFGRISEKIYDSFFSLNVMSKVTSSRDYNEDEGNGVELSTNNCRDYGWMRDVKKYHEFCDNGYTFYCGNLHDDGEPLEAFLRYYFELNINEDGLFIQSEG